MARQQMIEVKCDRCKRVEYVPIKKDKMVGEAKATLKIEFCQSGKGLTDKIKFDDLCSPCEKTIKNHIESISKEIKGKSPSRQPEAKERGDSTPSIEVDESTRRPSQSAAS